MTLNGDLVQYIKTGRFLFSSTLVTTAPTTSALSAFVAGPDDAANKITGYEDIGHTSVDDVFSFDSDEGQTTVIATFQAENFMEVEDTAPVDRLSVTPHQVKDPLIQKIYWGGGSVTADGQFTPPRSASRQPTIGSAIVLGWYGLEWMGFWLPKVSMRRGGGISFDAKALMKMPLTATILDPDDANLPPVVPLAAEFELTP